ncbi:hypothetical protein [Dactylosporangium matsuzakiense]|uniref:D-alanyl-D-alanine carboxypeptidase n=1 Tax=Dactylosporangium matsuzakiense TaxID=53360 RepID=A0A9W6KQ09_9ACTN|nr:hypothetical protein [Dactylosporangium matsuzakiense]UWZ44799.1 hypothetical protein Dmats_47055 [Dactylosporangium matsuzakiense]GLL06061.1 hypothetical protein GCM10017581_078090 [Dactylosporangium matsuzakiense]
MSINLTEQDQHTMRVAAYGAVTLLSAAGAAGGSPHRIATKGSIALGSATGLVGHVLATPAKHRELNGRSVAEIADRVLPALSATSALLRAQAPAEAGNFRATVVTAMEAATHDGQPGPAVADMMRKITAAIDA